MPRIHKVSFPQIVNMIPFVNISEKNIYIVTFKVADWNILNDSLVL